MVAPELPVVNLVVLVSSLLRHLCIHPIRVSAPSSTRAGRAPRAIVRVRTREREREREREECQQGASVRKMQCAPAYRGYVASRLRST